MQNLICQNIQVTYFFNHSKMGFSNSVTVSAKNNEDAINKAVQEVAKVYGIKNLDRFTYKVIPPKVQLNPLFSIAVEAVKKNLN